MMFSLKEIGDARSIYVGFEVITTQEFDYSFINIKQSLPTHEAVYSTTKQTREEFTLYALSSHK
jgi:hypothetical protein